MFSIMDLATCDLDYVMFEGKQVKRSENRSLMMQKMVVLNSFLFFN